MTAQLLTILCVMKFLHWIDKLRMTPSYCSWFNLDNARRFYGLRNYHTGKLRKLYRIRTLR